LTKHYPKNNWGQWNKVELIAPITWAQRLKRVFERAALGWTLPYARFVEGLCALLSTLLIQTSFRKFQIILQHNHHPLNVQPLANPKTFVDKQPNQLCAE
jgi:hypothetical protein